MHLPRLRRAASTLHHRLRPPVTITDPPPGIVVERDVAVPARDGVVLRVDVYRPEGPGPFPVLLCAHPYGKDRLPVPRRRGGYRLPFQYHLMVQSAPFSHSALTGWEGPDPAHWVGRGYAVVNADLRGWGHSDGVGTLLDDQEGRDVHDLVEWIAARPWCTGRVGMSGVSYLAISQWAGAAAAPPHLAAICPWEGFTDAYRDFGRPGGLRNDGFFRVWSFGQRVQRRSPVDVRAEQRARELRDDWWVARDRDLAAVTVPALVCGSFSDHDLHTRGSFEGFRRISSSRRWLWTHRGPKWATYYSAEGLAAQERFFDHVLRDEDTGWDRTPPVRIEVREDRDTISAVHHASDWPPPRVAWTPWHLDLAAGTLGPEAPTTACSATFDARRGRVVLRHSFSRDVELVGPMALRLSLSLPRGGDLSVFATVRKVRGGREVGFEGSYGFRDDAVTHGMLAASHRELDDVGSLPGRPRHRHTTRRDLAPDEIVTLDIELLPSATLFRAGEELHLEVAGRWPFRRNPLTGMFPAAHEGRGRGPVVLHDGHAHLLVPVLPDDGDPG